MVRLSATRQRLEALNGWQRLFVALALVWAVPVLSGTILHAGNSQWTYQSGEKAPVASPSQQHRVGGPPAGSPPRLSPKRRKMEERLNRRQLEALHGRARGEWVWNFNPISLGRIVFVGMVVSFLPLAVLYGVVSLATWIVRVFRMG